MKARDAGLGDPASHLLGGRLLRGAGLDVDEARLAIAIHINRHCVNPGLQQRAFAVRPPAVVVDIDVLLIRNSVPVDGNVDGFIRPGGLTRRGPIDGTHRRPHPAIEKRAGLEGVKWNGRNSPSAMPLAFASVVSVTG